MEQAYKTLSNYYKFANTLKNRIHIPKCKLFGFMEFNFYMVTANDSIIINGNKFISSGFGDEMMLMNLETGNYLGLNEVSADIYRQAEEQTTVNNIIHFLLKKYEVEEEVCKTQVLTCINDMLEKEVLVKI